MAQIGSKLHNCAKRRFLGESEQCYLCQSMVSHHAKMFQKNLCDSSWDIFLDPNCPFAWKEDFLGKLTTTAIVYLLCPIMLQYLKKILNVGQIMR